MVIYSCLKKCSKRCLFLAGTKKTSTFHNDFEWRLLATFVKDTWIFCALAKGKEPLLKSARTCWLVAFSMLCRHHKNGWEKSLRLTNVMFRIQSWFSTRKWKIRQCKSIKIWAENRRNLIKNIPFSIKYHQTLVSTDKWFQLINLSNSVLRISSSP